MSVTEIPDEVVVSGEGPVRRVTLNRPPQLNSISPGVHRSLAHVWRELSEDDEIRAVILTGAGRAFSAGGDFDLIERASRDAGFRYELLAEARQIVHEMVAFPVPVVAAVN